MALVPARSAAIVADIADLVSAIAWPAVAVALLLILREPLRELAERIGKSARRLSVGPGGVSVDFGEAVKTVATQDSTVLGDLRSPAPQLVDSGADTMFEQLANEQPAPYMLVDLGGGREWLSTRLYLLASMLVRMRRTRALVFVETAGDVRGRFVGVAGAEQVRWALAHEYPWLEADFAHAYELATANWRTTPPPHGVATRDRLVLDDHGRLDQTAARDLVALFVSHVQNAPPPPHDAAEWATVSVYGIDRAEHAQWLSGATLERALGPALDRFAGLVEPSTRPAAESAAATVGMRGHDVIALLDDQHRFRGVVIERGKALEALASQRPAEPED